MRGAARINEGLTRCVCDAAAATARGKDRRTVVGRRFHDVTVLCSLA